MPGDRHDLATNPEAWTPKDERVAARHFEYLQDGVAEGVVLLAGRAQDGLGPAIVIIETETWDSAEAFMNGDPFVASGLFSASLHPYRIALSRSGL